MKRFILLLLILCFLTGCYSGEKATDASMDFFAMDTYMSISANAVNAQQVVDESYEIVKEIESAISRTDESSDIYRLNHSEGKIIEVSDITYELLVTAIKCAQKTDGAFEPTICAVTDLWSIGTENARVPEEDEIIKALETVSYENIVLMESNQVQLLNGAQIDLGAVGKGYAADKIVGIYKEHDVVYGVISLAGNIYVYGEKDDGSLWKIGIQDPDDTSEINITLQTEETSVVTTGAYERYFEENGVVYHHIFDSDTGYPTKKDIKSVTVLCDNSMLADIYATALFAMGYEDAIDFVESEDDMDVIIIRENDDVYYSEDLIVTLGE
ncbi:MAG: FAD:protein FMN transferase [Eubacteriales bacterium]